MVTRARKWELTGQLVPPLDGYGCTLRMERIGEDRVSCVHLLDSLIPEEEPEGAYGVAHLDEPACRAIDSGHLLEGPAGCDRIDSPSPKRLRDPDSKQPCLSDGFDRDLGQPVSGLRFRGMLANQRLQLPYLFE